MAVYVFIIYVCEIQHSPLCWCNSGVFYSDLFPFNPRATPGSVLTMICSIRSNKCNQTWEDLKFEFKLTNGTAINVPKRQVTVINNTTVELNYPNVQPHFDRAVISCLVRGRRKSCRDSVSDQLFVGGESLLVCFFSSFAYLVYCHVCLRFWIARFVACLH